MFITRLPAHAKTISGAIWHWLASHFVYLAPACILLGFFIVFAIFYLPTRSLTFSYNQPQPCLSSPLLFPYQHQLRSKQSLIIEPQQTLSIAGRTIWANQVCFKFENPPEPGQHSVKLALFNWLLIAQTFRFDIPPPPSVNLAQLNQPVSVTKPLVLAMTDTDTVFSYQAVVADQSQDCQSSDQRLTCPIHQLELSQGQEYILQIHKTYGQSQPIPVVEQAIKTLSATTVVASSITDQQTIYHRPTSMTVEFDKEITALAVALANTDKPDKPIKLEHSLETKLLTITWPELERLSSFQLTVDQVEAKDGSTLEQPFIINFTTSGGPKVTNVNIGRAGVALGSTVVITFDQPLDASQDISQIVKINLGNSRPVIAGSTVSFKLSGLDRCVDFVINVAKGISSRYQTTSDTEWMYNSRTLCHTTEVIGTSVQGRPIVAYHFGSGATKILYTGAIHGNEVGTKHLMDRWIQELEAKVKDIPTDRHLIIIPVVNPDGFAAGVRNNARNVDLNRNWNVSDWQKDITDTQNQPLPGGGGEESMSEPETKALAALTNRLRPRTTISFHNVASVVIANQASHSTALAQAYSNLSGYSNATGQSATTFNYPITGTYDDWIAEKLGLASILVETASRTDAQWNRNVTGLWHVARY